MRNFSIRCCASFGKGFTTGCSLYTSSKTTWWPFASMHRIWLPEERETSRSSLIRRPIQLYSFIPHFCFSFTYLPLLTEKLPTKKFIHEMIQGWFYYFFNGRCSRWPFGARMLIFRRILRKPSESAACLFVFDQQMSPIFIFSTNQRNVSHFSFSIGLSIENHQDCADVLLFL